MRNLLDTIKRHETLANVLGAVVAVYAAAGMFLLGAKVPSERFWQPWRWPFILLLVAIVLVPLFALYQYFAKRNAEHERNRARLDTDMTIHCQQLAASLAHECPQVSLDDLAISIWLCRSDGEFDRRYRFFLPYDRQASGVHWRRGVGVAGQAWEQQQKLAVDLMEFNTKRGAIDPSRFDALPAKARYGMAYHDFDRTSFFTGVIATPLFAPHRAPGADPLAVVVVDYSGQQHFDCLKQAMLKTEIRQVIGAAARTLVDWQG